jgi:hypothetical protein
MREPTPSSPRWVWLLPIAAVALLPTAILGVLYSQAREEMRDVATTNSRLNAALAARQAELAVVENRPPRGFTATPTPTPTPTPASMLAVDPESVPYGEVPFAGNRLDRLRDLLADLRTRRFRGTVRAVSYIGDFCLTNTADGYVPAEADVIKRCDVIGNPYADSLTPAQQQSLGFANLISTVRRETGGKIKIEVAVAGRRPEVAYPESKSDQLTATEWNKIAAINNRVEFIVEPST